MLQATRKKAPAVQFLAGVDDTAWVGVVALFPAGTAVAVEGERTVPASTVMAARPRRRRRRPRRRRLLAVAEIVDVVGKLHVMVATWRPVAWLNTMQAFRPFARQGSYSAEKSALETAGCGVGQAGFSTLAYSSPLTTSAHVGETREVGGQGRAGEGWHPAGPARAPATPEWDVGWQAWRVDRQTPEPLRPPPPVGEGGTGGRAGARVQEESSFPDKG